MKKFVALTFGAVGLYLIVANATGFGKAVSAVGSNYVQGVKVLQGRG